MSFTISGGVQIAGGSIVISPGGSPTPSGGGFQGSNYGYSSGGVVYPPGVTNTIEKFTFSSDGNATDVGDLTVGRDYVSGQSSSVSGYVTGGAPPTNVIQKFKFPSDGNATDVADMTVRIG